jgi:hypothetical protein
MSTAFYPLGMKAHMPASGYNHKSTLYNIQYIPWKGTGIFSNPIGSAAGHIRPLTNKDPGNVFPTGFGLPRPIKHFRKGRVIPSQPIESANLTAKSPYNSNINLTIDEGALINYNMNRYVSSSKGTSLGGGFGGSGLLNEMQDKPGAFIIKQNTPNEINNINQLNKECKTCEGVGIVATYYPNNTYLTENPEPNVENPILCCNQEYKAKKRVIYASTNLKKNYYSTNTQYLQNRCKTYKQKAFNFLTYKTVDPGVYDSNAYYIAVDGKSGAKAGSPLSTTNLYLANCQPNAEIYDATENAIISRILGMMLTNNIVTQQMVNNFYTLNINSIRGFFTWMNTLPESEREQAITVFETFIRNPYWGLPLAGPSNPAGCQLVVYKPNNYQFAKQGAVDSSTRNLKLNVDTISTNAASIHNYNNTGAQLVTANELYAGTANNYNNILKNKAPSCNTPYPLNFFQSGRFQNKKYCYYKTLPQYQVPVSQLGTYRYFPRSVTNSNHFAQSPYTYNVHSRANAY